MPLQIASNNLKGMAMSKRPHILITDDDPIMREMLDAVLSDDYEVSVAPGGTEGIQIANEQDIDLVLLDVDMPSPNGYETCHFLKEDPSTAEIPVIFLSARSSIDERLRVKSRLVINALLEQFRFFGVPVFQGLNR